MDNLRWTLLSLGVLLVAVVYLFARFDLWQKLTNIQKSIPRNKPPIQSDRPRREPAPFVETDDAAVDEGHNFHFGEHEHLDDVPELHDRIDSEQYLTEEAYSAVAEEQESHRPDEYVEDFQHEELIPVLHDSIEIDDVHIDKTVTDKKVFQTHQVTDSYLGASSQDTEPLVAKQTDAKQTDIKQADIAQIDIEPLVLVLTIMASKDNRIQGPTLRAALDDEGFVFGDMDIFHYFHKGKSPALYGVVNVVEPGVFDLYAMDDISTPGITLFCQLPGVLPPTESFERLLTCARSLADKLQAKVCDDKRNTLTSQAINHYRDKIEAFNRQLVLARKA